MSASKMMTIDAANGIVSIMISVTLPMAGSAPNHSGVPGRTMAR